jgi:hypothetical protein
VNLNRDSAKASPDPEQGFLDRKTESGRGLKNTIERDQQQCHWKKMGNYLLFKDPASFLTIKTESDTVRIKNLGNFCKNSTTH